MTGPTPPPPTDSAPAADPAGTGVPKPVGYMPQLDGLRALAVGAVLYGHWLPRRYQFGDAVGVPFALAGVELFFVLSGFLITGILLKCRAGLIADRAAGGGTVGGLLRAFYARRFLRIFPLYYAVLLVAVLAGVPRAREDAGWHAAYLSNVLVYLEGGWVGPASHFWTLAVEEQFYVVWPFLILLLPARWVPRAIGAAVVGGAACQVLPVLAGWPAAAMWTKLLPANLDSLGLGGALALARAPGGVRAAFLGPAAAASGGGPGLGRRGAALVAVAAAVTAALGAALAAGLAFPLQHDLIHWGTLAVWVLLIDRAADGFGGPVGRLLGLRGLRYLGRISYGLYVLHNFAPFAVDAAAAGLGLPRPLRWARLGAEVAFTLAAAALSWHLFEAPLNRLKRFVPYRPKPTAAG